MDDSKMNEEWEKLKEWESQEFKKICDKYPYLGCLDNCKECVEAERALKKAFAEKVQQLKEKYHIQ